MDHFELKLGISFSTWAFLGYNNANHLFENYLGFLGNKLFDTPKQAYSGPYPWSIWLCYVN